MAKKTTVQITKDNIEQLDIKVGTILKDNEGIFWKITDISDFMPGMRVCDKDGKELKNFARNAKRTMIGGGLSDLLNDGITTYYIETEQPELKEEDVKNLKIVSDEISPSEIETERLLIQKKIQEIKNELENPNINYPDYKNEISDLKEYIERLEKVTDDEIKNQIIWKKENQRKNEETHKLVVEDMKKGREMRNSPKEGELLSYNQIHPIFTLTNKETGRKISIQPTGRIEENIKRLGRLKNLTEAKNAIEKIKASGFDIYSTENRVVLFNKDKFYDFNDSGESNFNFQTEKFEFNIDNRNLKSWDFKSYIEGGLKITKRMKAFEKIENETAIQENELNESVFANKEEAQAIYFNDLSTEQKEEVINGYRSADDPNMLTEWENLLRENFVQIQKDNSFISSVDIEKETSVFINPPTDEWISEYLQKNKVNFNTEFWQDIFAEIEAKPDVDSVKQNIETSQSLGKIKLISEEEQLKDYGITAKAHAKYFVKSTAEFEQFADFEPITNLTGEEAVAKYKELQKKGVHCGIGINIDGDYVFDDKNGNGITVLVRNDEGKDTLNIYGDSFVKNLKESDQHSFDVLVAFDTLYRTAKSAGLDVEDSPYIAEKENELFENLFSQNQIYDGYASKQATNYVLEKLKVAGIEVVTDKDEFERRFDEINGRDVFQAMTEKFVETEKTRISDERKTVPRATAEIKSAIKNALEKTAVPLAEVVYSRENYRQIFRDGIIQSPVETIKMGQNQFVRLCPPDRNNLMGAIYETMTKPSLVLEKETFDEKSQEFKPVHVYGKSFINEKNNHTHSVESIIIFRDGENIAASLHFKGIPKFIDQIKTADDIIYIDNEVSRVAAFSIKAGDSHVVKETQEFLSSAGRKSLPLINSAYNPTEILSIQDLIKQGKIEAGRLEITKENFDKYFNIFNQNTRVYKDNPNKISSDLLNFHVKTESRDEMKKWLEEQGYKISGKSHQFKISNGNVYGFTDGEKIYLNPDFLNSNVAVHEYTHLWDEYTRRTNPELWQKGMNIFKDTKFFAEVKSDPNYADIANDDNLVLSEVHARICGEMAEKILERIAKEDGEITRDKAIDWNDEVFEYVYDEFGFGRNSAFAKENGKSNGYVWSDYADFLVTPLKDLMNGKNISLRQNTEQKVELQSKTIDHKSREQKKSEKLFINEYEKEEKQSMKNSNDILRSVEQLEIMEINILNENGWRSANDIVSSNDNARKYLEEIKNRTATNLKLGKEEFSILEGDNYHTLNDALGILGVYGKEYQKDVLKKLEKYPSTILLPPDVAKEFVNDLILKTNQITPVSLEEILSVMEMKSEVTSNGKIKIYDQQRQEYIDNRSPLSDSDEDNLSFDNPAEIFERLDTYINDYFIADMEEQLQASGVTLRGDETLKDLCDYAKEQLEAGITTVSQGELNLAMGIINPETVIMPEGFDENKIPFFEKENIPKTVLEQLPKSSSELTADDLKNAKALLPKAQYQVVLEYTQGEEGEHFKGIIKEISSKAEAIKGKKEIFTKDEKHPLAFKYMLGTSSFYFSEWDGADELFGYAILNGDTQMSEWGYTSLEELKNAGGKDRNGFPVMPEMIFYGLEDTIERQIAVDYPELSEKMGFAPKLNHNEELISEFGKEIFKTLQSHKLEQNSYNICCAAQFIIQTMDSSEKKEIFSIMEKCGCKGKNGKANTENFLTEVVKAENNTASSVYDRKRLYEKINKSCSSKKTEKNEVIHNTENDYNMEI